MPDPQARSFPHRVIPAVVGGVFAGLMLVGMGCTPFFQKPAKSSAEQGTVVNNHVISSSSGAAATAIAPATANAPGDAARHATASSSNAAAAPSHGTPSVAATSAAHGGVMAATEPSGTDRFTIFCHSSHDDPNSPRPETVSLQGIMAGQSARAALLDGVLYREGDRFGSTACPWTIALIDASSVRIEKLLGDRICGITILWQRKDAGDPSHAAAPSSAPAPARSRSAPAPTSAASGARPRPR